MKEAVGALCSSKMSTRIVRVDITPDYEGDVFLQNVGKSLLVLDDSSVCYICSPNFSESRLKL